MIANAVGKALSTIRIVAAVMLVVFASGCAQRLAVSHVATAAEPPGNVAVYLSVKDGERGIGDLTSSDFSIYEDGKLLEPGASGLKLLDRDIGVVRHTVMLVDLSDAADRDRVEQIARAVSISARRIGKTQPVTVYGFADSNLKELANYSPSNIGSEKDLSLDDFVAPGESSRDVYGAVIAGLERLDSMKPEDSPAVLVGTLVVFLSGPDRAKKVDPVRMDLAFARFKHHVLSVAAGKWKEDPSPFDVGRDGVFQAKDDSGILQAFSDAAASIESDYAGSYLLAYCSPSRSGYRNLRIEVKATSEGREIRGKVDTEFDATGFTGGCTAGTAPAFASVEPKAPTKPEKAKPKRAAGKGPPPEAPAQPEVPAPPPPADTDDGFAP